VVSVFAGCGSNDLELLPVEGTVTLNGTPVEGAAVMFVSGQGGHVATGVTDARGRFTLQTANRPGAVAGEHRVTVVKQVTHDPIYEQGGGVGELGIEWIVPERYSKPDTSGLSADVEPEQREFHFQLSSPGGAGMGSERT
jgi:hypothetical protein